MTRIAAHLRIVALALLLLVGAVAPVRAQSTGIPPAVGMPATWDFIPLMEEATHKAAADSLRAAELAATDALAACRDLESEAKSRLTSRKSTLESLKKQIDLADKDKRESDQKALEAERKNEEAARTFFERLLALREAETEREKSSADMYRAAALMHDRALELLVQRRKYTDTKSVTSSAQLSSRDSNLSSGEKQYLESARKWSERAVELAARERTVAERRQAAWDALREVRR